VVAPTSVNYGSVVLALMARFDLYWPHVVFLWSPVNLVAIELLRQTASPALRWFVGGGVRHQGDGRAQYRWETRLHPGSRGPNLT
jgi:hypothetical protein